MVAEPDGTSAGGRGTLAPHRHASRGRTPIVALRQLLLLRHAKSSWDDRNLSDHARPLNVRGRRAAVSMRLAMRDLGLEPDVVLVSSARRTLQTLEALEPWDATPLIEPMDALYLADPDQMFGVLRTVSETARSVLLIGHNPGIHELAVRLIGEESMSLANPDMRRLAEGFPTGALAEFLIPGAWQTLTDAGGRLTRFLSPRDLPELTH
jgi:phosphohistidine phosphatase